MKRNSTSLLFLAIIFMLLCSASGRGCGIAGCVSGIKGCAGAGIKGCAKGVKGCAKGVKGCAKDVKGCAKEKPQTNKIVLPDKLLTAALLASVLSNHGYEHEESDSLSLYPYVKSAKDNGQETYTANVCPKCKTAIPNELQLTYCTIHSEVKLEEFIIGLK